MRVRPRECSRRASGAHIHAVALLLLATIALGIGIAIEKSEEGGHHEASAVTSSEAGESTGADSEISADEPERPMTW